MSLMLNVFMNNKVMMKVVFILALCLVGITSYAADSTCSYNSGFSDKTVSVNVGNIILQRDAPVGTVLYQKVVPINTIGSYPMNCTSGNTVWYLSSGSRMVAVPGYTTTYEIGVEGVGVNVVAGSDPNSSRKYTYPATNVSSGFSGGNIYAQDDLANASIVFVKTASSTGSGAIDIGVYGEFSTAKTGGGYLYPINFNVSGGTITTVACEINSSSITVNLGDVLAGSFTGTGSTPKSVDFQVGLECDAGANINVSMTGTQNSETSDTSVLGLTGAGNADVANGVGVQIAYDGTPLKLNENIKLKTSEGGQELLPFTARYYQTKAEVKNGAANATATLNLTYQ